MSSGLSTSARSYIKANLNRVEELPDPDEEWIAYDADINNSQLEGLAKRGIIHKREKVTIPKGRGRSVWKYKTDKKCYEVIQDMVYRRDNTDGFLPCNHDRFTTTADEVKCKSCDEVWSKEEVREHNE